MIVHFCIWTICSAVFAMIVASNAAPINFLKVLVNNKKGKDLLHLVAPTSVQAIAHGYDGPPPRKMFSRDVHVRVVTDVARPSTVVVNNNNNNNNSNNSNNNNNSNNSNNAVFQQLCSAIQYAATMQQCRPRGKDDDEHAGRQSYVVPTVAAAERRRSYRKSYRKRKFSPPADDCGTGYDLSGVTARPADRYQDPILIQESSQVVDYLTSYPLAKVGQPSAEDEKYYDDVDQPAEVWKINVVGEPMSKSSKTSSRDDDDDDDEKT